MSLAMIAPDPSPDAAAAKSPRIALFHQNDVFAMQGGIERYISTLYEAAPERVVLVSPPISHESNRHFAVSDGAWRNAPQWLRFLVGLFSQRRAIGAFLRQHSVRVMEFSRPEYILAAWLFPGKRVVTIHGTGPGPGHRLHYLLHHACCLLLPLLADRVQVIGRDPSGLPGLARRLLGPRLAYVDAWRDDSFSPAALPPLAAGDRLRVFYAGRIAPQKNPRLLFEIIREAAQSAPDDFEFHYFGSDYETFANAGLGSRVKNHGFLGPQPLAEAIRSCHLGLMCSAFGEGSPYILIEALACGRPFVIPTLPTLVSAYQGFEGVHFVEHYRAEDYVAAIGAVRAAMLAGEVDPLAISAQTESRSKSRAVPALLDAWARLDD
jgi:glycosyltransferase involved in cell wall biosynthesis